MHFATPYWRAWYNQFEVLATSTHSKSRWKIKPREMQHRKMTFTRWSAWSDLTEIPCCIHDRDCINTLTEPTTDESFPKQAKDSLCRRLVQTLRTPSSDYAYSCNRFLVCIASIDKALPNASCNRYKHASHTDIINHNWMDSHWAQHVRHQATRSTLITHCKRFINSGD